jgi:hypothetical protein
LGDTTNISHVLPSELDVLKNRILSEESANECEDRKFGEAWQEDFESDGCPCGHSPARYCLFSSTIQLGVNAIRSLGVVSSFSHRQLRMEQNSLPYAASILDSGCFSLQPDAQVSCFSCVISSSHVNCDFTELPLVFLSNRGCILSRSL